MMKNRQESSSSTTTYAVFDVSSDDLADWIDFRDVLEDDMETECGEQLPTVHPIQKESEESEESDEDVSEPEPIDEQMGLINYVLAHFMNPLMVEMQNLIAKANTPLDQPKMVDADLGAWMQQQVSKIVFDPSGTIKISLSPDDYTNLQQICAVVGKQTFKRPHVSVEVLVLISKWLRKAGVQDNSALWIAFYKLLNRSRSSVSKRKRQEKVEAMEIQRKLVQQLEQRARDARLLVSKAMPDISQALDPIHQHVFIQLYLEWLHSVDQVIAGQYTEYMRREKALQDDEMVSAPKQPYQQYDGQQLDGDAFMNVLAVEPLVGDQNDHSYYE
eukprot:CAMPEP_0184708844 /NCGR_PEP_ID=MMETSP0313-20130426/37986_1 /TAXON_ID=2792 /ORGANISM="Porphyridium aerugineum, Strain SAG 1380-2" /LENGTH=329 /DNA_ID=CAMNT_0027170449 /DNA_START=90 /DNA_END=1079 /DNA_ORIENTATION=-